MLLLAAVCLTACAIPGLGRAPAEPVAAPRAAAPSPARSAPGPCLGYNGLDGLNPAAQIKAGRFRSPGTPPVRVATGTDVDWGLDPHRDRTWQLWLHSLEWLGGLIKEYRRSHDRAALDLAAGIARDWLADNARPDRFGPARREAIEEGAKFRLATLACLRAHLSDGWLDEAIVRHAQWLAEPRHWSGPWNHGTDESMILLAAACRIGRDDLARVAYGRLVDAVLRPPGGARPAIDAQGANNEQSTQYSVYNRGRWRRAIEVMRACRRPVPPDLARRHSLMDEFIAFQATPAGDLLQIGESYASTVSRVSQPGQGAIRYALSQGRAGAKPSARARVYEAGYVMGRSGWGDGDRPYREEMAYTARFGPGRYAHGQDDHMALTFYAQGRDVLVPSGHTGYSDPRWRDWLHSPDAQNTVVVRGVPFRSDAATALTGHRFAEGGDFFRFSDTAFAGATRTRSVLAASDPDALVVLDQVRSAVPLTVEQLWHLPADFEARPRGGDAVATAGGVRIHFLRVPVPVPGGTAQNAAAPGVPPAVTLKGDTPQGRGWIMPKARTRLPAPVVKMPARGADVRILTVIAPVRDGARPSVRTFPPGPDGTYRIEAVVTGRRLAVTAAPDGTLTRTG
ncbi:heparinase II/III domain-containing protein [Actinomadura vinacea]|uniref:heparinase II/III domain-containing protein n=1 Tax=Actinomadura vinacea TaxID=115336 RepID=UPI0031D1ED80